MRIKTRFEIENSLSIIWGHKRKELFYLQRQDEILAPSKAIMEKVSGNSWAH